MSNEDFIREKIELHDSRYRVNRYKVISFLIKKKIKSQILFDIDEQTESDNDHDHAFPT